MHAPHTVTIYNSVKETDQATFKDVTKLYVTILRGVLCEASKGANVRKTGLEGADAVNLYIPFSVEAIDGATGKPKKYVGPQEFYRATDKPDCGRFRSAATAGLRFSSRASLSPTRKMWRCHRIIAGI